MLYQYPFCYRNDYYLVGGQRVSHRYLIDILDVDIPEMTSDEAPIAAAWRDMTATGGPAMHVRYVDGCFLKPLTTDVMSAEKGLNAADLPVQGRTTGLAVSHLLSGLRVHWDVGRYTAPTRQWLTDNKSQHPPKEHTIASFLGSTYDEMKALAVKFAEGLRIVDGKVYTRTPEPVFTFHGNVGQEIVVHVGDVNYDRYERYQTARGAFETHFVRLDNLQEAVERAGRTNDANVTYRFADLSINVPEAFEFDVAENAVARAVGKIVYECERLSPLAWDRGKLNAFLDIHDDYLGYIDDPDAFDILEIMMRTKDVIANQPDIVSDKYVEFLRAVEWAETAPMKINAGAIIGTPYPRP
jgi:hypothetical protein